MPAFFLSFFLIFLTVSQGFAATVQVATYEGLLQAALEKILSRDNGKIILQSRELDQYGRPIADVWVKGKPVDQELLDKELAINGISSGHLSKY